MHTLISVFWFFLPAGVANMAPVLFNWLPFLDVPVDFGWHWRGKQLFGANKTWRGLVTGCLAAIGIVYLQKWLAPHTASINLIDYAGINLIGLGIAQGLGALGGDLIESFAKRRAGIPAGKSWVPFDQLDWIAGALVLTVPLVILDAAQVVAALLLFGLLHPLANLLGYALKLKPNKF